MYLDDCIFLKCCYHRILLVYSPRMWRWSYQKLHPRKGDSVFSTYVEMIPTPIKNPDKDISILHVCGDDPILRRAFYLNQLYSPRMWRWSFSKISHLIFFIVFSTYVEMIPKLSSLKKIKKSILHVCGDDPKFLITMLFRILYSPRMWRWSYLISA